MRWWLLLCALASSGCFRGRSVPPAAQPVPVAVAVVLASVDDGSAAVVPAGVIDRLGDEVTKRNLVPEAIDAEAVATQRTTGDRLGLLAEGAAAESLLLLVESQARFSSQINGRYRWTVDVDLSLARADALEEQRGAHLAVPVHLVYYHERAPEALSGAAPVIAREVGHLLDDWVGGG